MSTLVQFLGKKMSGFFMSREMLHDALVFRAFLVLTTFVLIEAALIGYYYYRFPEVIVIHSSIYFGIDLIGVRAYSLAIPGAALAISLLHLSFAKALYLFNKELARVLLVGTVVVLLFILVNTFLIINLNA